LSRRGLIFRLGRHDDDEPTTARHDDAQQLRPKTTTKAWDGNARTVGTTMPGNRYFDVEILDIETLQARHFQLEGTVSPGLSGVP
jgi:hypothetical protein